MTKRLINYDWLALLSILMLVTGLRASVSYRVGTKLGALVYGTMSLIFFLLILAIGVRYEELEDKE